MINIILFPQQNYTYNYAYYSSPLNIQIIIFPWIWYNPIHFMEYSVLLPYKLISFDWQYQIQPLWFTQNVGIKGSWSRNSMYWAYYQQHWSHWSSWSYWDSSYQERYRRHSKFTDCADLEGRLKVFYSYKD